MHFAVIDLGTNTFHLLIVRRSGEHFEEVYRNRVFVNIAEEGISKLGDACYRRAMDAIMNFQSALEEYDDIRVQTFGTAALRTASNGPQFQKEVKDKTGITIQIIDGNREAELISIGTKSIVDTSSGNYLIMDIGGGSVEFILIKNGIDTYVRSFPVGITALYNEYPHHEPLREKDRIEIFQYLNKVLDPLKKELVNLKIDGLIGASGSYEVLEKIISGTLSKHESRSFPVDDVKKQMNIILAQTLEQRLNNKDIPSQRAKLIVTAFLLIEFVFDLSEFNSLIISPYALKEGAIIEMLEI